MGNYQKSKMSFQKNNLSKNNTRTWDIDIVDFRVNHNTIKNTKKAIYFRLNKQDQKDFFFCGTSSDVTSE